MPTPTQMQQIASLLAEGHDESAVAAATGVEIGDVESIKGGAMFVPQAGVPTGARLSTFEIAPDTPGITSAQGVAAFTPIVGTVLLTLWVALTETFDGTTPILAAEWDVPDGGLLAAPIQAGLAVPPTLTVSSLPTPFAFPSGSPPLRLGLSSDGNLGGPDPGSTVGHATLYVVTLTRS